MSGKIQMLLDQADAVAESSEAGTSSIACAERGFSTEAEAADRFARFSRKLLQINGWNLHSALMSFEFFDAAGAPIGESETRAAAGDLIRIKTIGTGKADWVKIARIDDDAPDELILTVQPTFDPTAAAPDKSVTSHFFTPDSSNHFCLRKTGATINFYVVGLNEKSNTEHTKNILETARNVATANLGHFLGIQKAEWTAFCKSFLNSE